MDDTPATRADLQQTGADLKQEMHSLRADLTERMRDMQTELLRGMEALVLSTQVQLQRLNADVRNY